MSHNFKSLPIIIPELYKIAAATSSSRILTKLFGAGKAGTSGGQDILKGVTQSALGTAVTASGALVALGLADAIRGESAEQSTARDKELGKLTAQTHFKTTMLGRLAPSHIEVFKKVMQDPIISKADKDLMISSYDTMKRFAPNLAADVNAARSFLREPALHGTGPNYATLKNLADAEQAIARAGGTLG